jgi:hypothetical protein
MRRAMFARRLWGIRHVRWVILRKRLAYDLAMSGLGRAKSDRAADALLAAIWRGDA